MSVFEHISNTHCCAHSDYASMFGSLGSSDLLRSVQMLKREWGAESNGKLLHLFIPGKTTALVPGFAVKDLPLDRTLMMMDVNKLKQAFNDDKTRYVVSNV